jgi:hypothetical protein
MNIGVYGTPVAASLVLLLGNRLLAGIRVRHTYPLSLMRPRSNCPHAETHLDSQKCLIREGRQNAERDSWNLKEATVSWASSGLAAWI